MTLFQFNNITTNTKNEINDNNNNNNYYYYY